MSKPLREKLGYFVLLPAALYVALAAPLMLSGIGTESDFINYYAAGKLVRESQGAKLYDDAAELAVQRTFTNHTEPLIYNHPPFEAAIFVPFAYLPFRTAFLVWIYVSMSLLGAALYVVRREIARLGTVERLIGLLFLFFPLLALLVQGQDSLLVLFSFALGFAALRSGKQSHAGLALAIGTVKPQLVLPFLAICLLGVQRKFALGFATGCLALAGISLAMVGWDGTWQYPALLAKMAMPAAQQRFHIAPWAMPNLRGFAYFALGGASHAGLGNAVAAGLSVLLILAAMRKSKDALESSSPSFELAFEAAMSLAVVLSYHLFLHDVCIVVLPAVLLLSQAAKEPWGWRKKLLHISLGAFGAGTAILLALKSDELCLLFLPLAAFAWVAWLARRAWPHTKTSF